MLDQQQAAQVKFLAERVGRDYRGEVVDSRTGATILRTHLSYRDAHTAGLAAQCMWESRAKRIAKAISGEVAA